jgi:hypothetical protein
MNRNLQFLYLMELCAGLARGSYLVCIGWTTLVVIGDVMFSFAAMTMCLSPSLVKLSATSDYFLYWGMIVVVSSLLLWSARPGSGIRPASARS